MRKTVAMCRRQVNARASTERTNHFVCGVAMAFVAFLCGSDSLAAMLRLLRHRIVLLLVVLLAVRTVFAWDYEGHRIVNRLALVSLPTNFPAFALTEPAQERIQFLGGEPDRWRNTIDLPFKHSNGPDHYLDIEDLADYGLTPKTVSHFRHEFTAQLVSYRALHPDKFREIHPTNDLDHTKALIGFLPWTLTEYYAKLKSEFSYLKVFEELGTAAEVSNAQANIIYTMGVMGHFAGDAAQPLHTTRHYNGWVGDNPKGYPTNKTFHAWIDGGFIAKAQITAAQLLPRVRPARLPWSDPSQLCTNAFPDVMKFLELQHTRVEPIYQLEKDLKFWPGQAGELEGRGFIERSLLEGAQFLGDL
jgi:hypothetical protein